MKRICLSVLCISFVVAVNAQTNKNDWMVGGHLRLNTSSSNTEIGFSPSAGLFVIDNLAIGGNVLFNYSKAGDNKRTDVGIGPFARYIFTSQNNVRPIIQTSFNFLSTRNEAGNTSSTQNGINYFIGGGASIFLSDRVSIDGLMGYQHSKYKGFDGSGGFALNIGFQVYLPKK